MTAMDFITSVFADAWSHEQPQHITPEEAAQTMRAWADEGMPAPATVTPRLFAATWNILCDRAATTDGTRSII